LALSAGIVLIILMDPPYSICDAEKESFTAKQKSFLIKAKAKFKTKSQVTILRTNCLQSNSPGGCFEYFKQLRLMVEDLNSVSQKCRQDVGSISNLKKSFWAALDIIVKIAWTDKPPKNAYYKKSWLGGSDMNLFCNLKRLSLDFYTEDKWRSFQEKMLTTLPGTDKLSREKVWSLSLLSEQCTQYL
jgi:hypothetical protein